MSAFFFDTPLRQDICFLHGESCHSVGDLHDLFLVHDDAVRRLEDAFDARVVIVDLFLAVLAVDVLLNAACLDGTWTIQGNNSGQVFDRGRLNASRNAFHAGRFHLKHANRIPAADQLVDGRILGVDAADVYGNAQLLSDHVDVF